MEANKVSRPVLENGLIESRKRGKPRRGWMECMSKDLSVHIGVTCIAVGKT